jgi:hypothetical protein
VLKPAHSQNAPSSRPFKTSREQEQEIPCLSLPVVSFFPRNAILVPAAVSSSSHVTSITLSLAKRVPNRARTTHEYRCQPPQLQFNSSCVDFPVLCSLFWPLVHLINVTISGPTSRIRLLRRSPVLVSGFYIILFVSYCVPIIVSHPHISPAPLCALAASPTGLGSPRLPRKRPKQSLADRSGLRAMLNQHFFKILSFSPSVRGSLASPRRLRRSRILKHDDVTSAEGPIVIHIFICIRLRHLCPSCHPSQSYGPTPRRQPGIHCVSTSKNPALSLLWTVHCRVIVAILTNRPERVEQTHSCKTRVLSGTLIQYISLTKK